MPAAEIEEGVLVKSIREGWSAPPAYVQAQTKKQRAEKAKKTSAETVTATSEQSAAESAFETWWNAQPEDQRSIWIAEAEALLRQENRTLAELGQKHPRSQMYREALRTYQKRVGGYQERKN